jgi:hypothetical protein
LYAFLGRLFAERPLAFVAQRGLWSLKSQIPHHSFVARHS